MYHDEFRKPVARSRTDRGAAGPSLSLEVGGGLSLGLAASLDQPIAMALFYLGGVLPLVTCCLSIAAGRAAEFLTGLAPRLEIPRLSAIPTPHLAASSGRVAAPHRRREGARTGR